MPKVQQVVNGRTRVRAWASEPELVKRCLEIIKSSNSSRCCIASASVKPRVALMELCMQTCSPSYSNSLRRQRRV